MTTQPAEQYLSMEDLGAIRESSDPDALSIGEWYADDESAQQPFEVLGEPWMPAPRRTMTVEISHVRALPWWREVLAAAIMGLLLLPLLGFLARFVRGEPILGSRIEAAAKSRGEWPGPFGPGSYGRV